MTDTTNLIVNAVPVMAAGYATWKQFLNMRQTTNGIRPVRRAVFIGVFSIFAYFVCRYASVIDVTYYGNEDRLYFWRETMAWASAISVSIWAYITVSFFNESKFDWLRFKSDK